MWRAFRKRRPYCGGTSIFKSWFTLKDRCPTLYAYEDGYFLGAYAINLVVTELLTVAVVIWLIAGTDLDVLAMQLTGCFGLCRALPAWYKNRVARHPLVTSSTSFPTRQ